MGNGARAEYMSAKLFYKLPKRDLANALKVAFDRILGVDAEPCNPVREETILEFVNKERKLLGRKPIKIHWVN